MCFVPFFFLCRWLTEAGYIEHMNRILLEHECVDASTLFDRFVQQCIGSAQTAKSNAAAFRKQMQREQRADGEISSEDETLINPEQVHYEFSVDHKGAPIEFPGEDVMTGAYVGKKVPRKNASGIENLEANSFVVMTPDPESDHKLFVVQMLEVNPEPDNKATWVKNNNKQWHYRGGWWELQSPNVVDKIQKCMVRQGVANLFNTGTDGDVDWNDEAAASRFQTGRKVWWCQYFDRNEWHDREVAVNVVMNGSKVADRAFPKKLVAKLARQFPRDALDSSKPRVPQVDAHSQSVTGQAGQHMKSASSNSNGQKHAREPQLNVESGSDTDRLPQKGGAKTVPKNSSQQRKHPHTQLHKQTNAGYGGGVGGGNKHVSGGGTGVLPSQGVSAGSSGSVGVSRFSRDPLALSQERSRLDKLRKSGASEMQVGVGGVGGSSGGLGTDTDNKSRSQRLLLADTEQAVRSLLRPVSFKEQPGTGDMPPLVRVGGMRSSHRRVIMADASGSDSEGDVSDNSAAQRKRKIKKQLRTSVESESEDNDDGRHPEQDDTCRQLHSLALAKFEGRQGPDSSDDDDFGGFGESTGGAAAAAGGGGSVHNSRHMHNK